MNWSDEAQDVMAGDLVTGFAYTTPAGGAVGIPVSPTGAVNREAGQIGVTTSLAFNGKLRRILRDPRVAMAYHTRDHGFATGDAYVLAQGIADVPLTPSPERLAALAPQIDRFLGPTPTGPIWDWALREYHEQRVIVDIALRRVTTWPALDAGGTPSVAGDAWPAEDPMVQKPPAKGTAPRVDLSKLYKQVRPLPHQLIAYTGADGFPVVVPVQVAGQTSRGLHLEVAEGLLPPGGRRAGLTAHSFGPQAVGLANRVATGWLDVDGDTAIYAPHTASGFTVPPIRSLQTFANGMMAKQGIRRARKNGTFEELAQIKAEAPVRA